MLEVQSGEVVTNGVRLHYYRTGGDKPPLVLSHGFTDSGLCWTRLARDLAADFDVVMYDLRAHGLSEAPDRGYSADDRAVDLLGLVESLRLERPILLGHSMGAETTAYAAAAAPDLPRAIILEDPPFVDGFYAATLEARAAKAEELRAQIVERQKLTLQQLLAESRGANATWTEVDLGPWAEAKHLVHPNAALRRRDVPRTGWRETLAQITCPTLVITADVELGGLITPEVAREMSGLLARCQVAHVAGASHNVRRDRYEPYLAAVRAFVVALDTGRAKSL